MESLLLKKELISQKVSTTQEEYDQKKKELAQVNIDIQAESEKERNQRRTDELNALREKIQTKIQSWVDVVDDMDKRKMHQYEEMISKFDKEKEHFMSINGDLEAYCTDNVPPGVCTLVPEDFRRKVCTMADSSLVIFIEQADKYRNYEKDAINIFERDDHARFHNPDNGPVYEVVRDNQPQKPMIVTSDTTVEDMSPIKQHIVDFIKENYSLPNASLADLVVYSNNNTTEFLFCSLLLKDLAEKHSFTRKFRSFMQGRDKTIATKIIALQEIVFDIEGVTYHKLPSSKTLIGQTNIGMVDQLLSRPIIVNNYTIIGDQNTMQVGNDNNAAQTGNSIKKPIKTMKTFAKELYDTKPEWYIEDDYVDIDHLEDAFREYFDDYDTIKTAVSRLTAPLFSNSRRSHGTTQKKMKSYTALQKYFSK